MVPSAALALRIIIATSKVLILSPLARPKSLTLAPILTARPQLAMILTTPPQTLILTAPPQTIPLPLMTKAILKALAKTRVRRRQMQATTTIRTILVMPMD